MQIIGKKVITEIKVEINAEDYEMEVKSIVSCYKKSREIPLSSLGNNFAQETIALYSNAFDEDRNFEYELADFRNPMMDVVVREIAQRVGITLTHLGNYNKLTKTYTFTGYVEGNHIE